MGNRRSVEKALEHVGAQPVLTADHDGDPRRRRARRAGRGRVPGGDAQPRAPRARRGDPRARRPRACRVLGLCLGMQLLFEPSTEHEGADGLGLLPGTVTALRAPRIPHIGWNLVAFRRPSLLTAGLGEAAAFYHVHSLAAGRRSRTTSSGSATTASASPRSSSAATSWACSSTPRSPRATGSRCCGTSPHVPDGRRVILYPAIDIMDGRAVRLVQGRFEDSTTYDDDPLEAAQSWVAAGARFLHVVDLDGARDGEPRSIEHLRRIVPGTGVPVQYGGGLRTVEAVREALRAGAERAIVGTAAFRDVDFLDEIVSTFGPRIIVSVDVRDGFISTAGWTKTTELPAADAIRHLQDRGVTSFVYSNVDRDGMLEGPDLHEVATSPRPSAAASSTPAASAAASTSRPRRAAPGQPRRGHRRQGPVRAALHGGRGPGGARRRRLIADLARVGPLAACRRCSSEGRRSKCSRAPWATPSRGRGLSCSSRARRGSARRPRSRVRRRAASARGVLLAACDDLVAPRPLGPLRDPAAGGGGPLATRCARGGRVDGCRRHPGGAGARAREGAGGRGRPLGGGATLDVWTMLGRRIERLQAVHV